MVDQLIDNGQDVLRQPEQDDQERIVRISRQKTGLYPIDGKEILQHLDAVEPGDNGNIDHLKQVVEWGLAWHLGCVTGQELQVRDIDPQMDNIQSDLLKVADKIHSRIVTSETSDSDKPDSGSSASVEDIFQWEIEEDNDDVPLLTEDLYHIAEKIALRAYSNGEPLSANFLNEEEREVLAGELEERKKAAWERINHWKDIITNTQSLLERPDVRRNVMSKIEEVLTGPLNEARMWQGGRKTWRRMRRAQVQADIKAEEGYLKRNPRYVERSKDDMAREVQDKILEEEARFRRYLKAAPQIERLRDRVHAIDKMDQCMSFKVGLSGDEEEEADTMKRMGYRVPTVDSEQFIGEFQLDKKDGEAVSILMKEMVLVCLGKYETNDPTTSIDRNCYIDGFTGASFKNWLKKFSELSGGNVARVKRAWERVQMMDMLAPFSLKEETDSEKGIKVMKFAPTWACADSSGGQYFFDERRFDEMGRDLQGDDTGKTPHYNKTGHPFSIGKVCRGFDDRGSFVGYKPLIASYLEGAKVHWPPGELDRAGKPKKTDLWTIYFGVLAKEMQKIRVRGWREGDQAVFDRGISLADQRFPLADTERRDPEHATEPGIASWAFFQKVMKGRAWG